MINTTTSPKEPMALVTCSYSPDFSRCQKLCASVDQYVGREHHHYIVVPDRDLALFRPLQNGRRTIVAVQDILPAGFIQLAGLKKWWLDDGLFPVRGWMVQQLTKLSADQLSATEDILFLDSDIEFIRPFDRSRYFTHGATRLHRIPNEGNDGVHLKWHQASAKLFGFEPRYFGADYVGAVVSWKRSNLIAMKAHIEAHTGRAWHQAVGRQLTVSEYTLYGVFVEHVLGFEQARHYPCTQGPCHCLWFGEDTDRFLAKLEQGDAPQAVLVQSNIGLAQSDVDELVAQVRANLAA